MLLQMIPHPFQLLWTIKWTSAVPWAVSEIYFHLHLCSRQSHSDVKFKLCFQSSWYGISLFHKVINSYMLLFKLTDIKSLDFRLFHMLCVIYFSIQCKPICKGLPVIRGMPFRTVVICYLYPLFALFILRRICNRWWFDLGWSEVCNWLRTNWIPVPLSISMNLG